MRIGRLKIEGTEYPLCLSTRVAIACEERAGSIDTVLNKIVDESSVKELFWLLHQMIIAGCDYEKMNGRTAPEPITYEKLIDVVGPSDYADLTVVITSAIQGGSERNVKTRPVKNKKNGETR